MKKTFLLFVAALACFARCPSHAANTIPFKNATSGAAAHSVAGAHPDHLSRLWQAADPARAEAGRRQLKLRPGKGRVLALDATAFNGVVAGCPREFTAAAQTRPVSLSLPMPDGSFQRFAVVESPVMAPELAAKFPEIKTYCGQGLDDPTVTVRFSVSPRGLHAQVLTPGGPAYVQPCLEEQPELYASFDAQAVAEPDSSFSCLTMDAAEELSPWPKSTPGEVEQEGPPPPPPIEEVDLKTGSMLRVYRLAVAAPGEWTALHGGTVSSALAAIVSMINQVSGYYEREFAIRLQFVANNDLLIYTDATTDPFTTFQRQDFLIMVYQNQAAVDSMIGPANYDLGTLFFVGNWGTANRMQPCDDTKGALKNNSRF